MRKSRHFALVGGILLAAGGLAWFLVATKPEPPANPPRERAYLVEAIPVAIADRRPTFTVYGEIVAAGETELRARVAAPVEKIGESFKVGAVAETGDLLVALDSFKYEKDLIEHRAALREARARLDELQARRDAEAAMIAEDRLQAELSRRDLDRRQRLGTDVVSEKALDDARIAASQAASRLIQAEQAVAALDAQIAQQQAVIARMEAAVSRAERDLAETEIRAPFRAHVVSVAAAAGSWVSVGQAVGRLNDIDSLEARLFLSESQFGQLIGADDDLRDRPVTLIWRVGERTEILDARIRRVDGAFEAETGGVHVYAELDGLPPGLPLRAGAFIEARLEGRLYRDAARIPDRALHDGDTVYVVDDGRLAARRIDVLAHDRDRILVRGDLAHGEAIVVTRLAEMAPGLKVDVASADGRP